MKKRLMMLALGVCLCFGGISLHTKAAEWPETGTEESSEFSYAQDFPELGVQIRVQASDYAIPANASVQIAAVAEEDMEGLDEIIRRKVDEALNARSSAAGEGRTIFDMYANLEAAAERSTAFQIKITYTDEEGTEHTIRPEENGAVRVIIEQLGEEAASADELHSEEVFSLTEELPMPYSAEEAPSVYSYVFVRYEAKADEQMIAAQERAWEIINAYTDWEYFLADPDREEITDEQYEELRQAALTATAGCAATYDKIKAIVGFVAERTYYDYYYLNNKQNVSVYVNPYDVYKYQRTVCAGYARLVRTLMISIGIPCMDIIGDNHEYNAVYDSQQGKWIFADATWCSRNSYNIDDNGKEIWDKRGYSYSRFDLAPEEIAKLSSHEVYGVDGLSDQKYDSVYYSLTAPADNWKQMNWIISISDIKNAKADVITAVETLAGFPVKEVKGWAFANREDITGKLVLPKSVKSIGYCAFYKCSGLTGDLTLPEGLTRIDDFAFSGCSGLNGTLTLPEGLTSIGNSAFSGCSGLKGGLTLPEGLVSIGNHTFLNCSGLNGTLTLPEGLTSIGNSAFSGCSGLKGSLTLSEGLVSIGDYTFSNCSSLNGSLTLPKSLTSIGYCAFYHCSSLTGNLVLPAGLTSIGGYAFSGCSGLKGSLELPTGLESIENYTFYNCSGLDGKLTLPAGLVSIGDSAFYNCGSLRGELRIPSKVKSIGKYAFACFNGSAMDENIVLPASVESIGDYAFYRSKVSHSQIAIYAPEGSYAEEYANANGYAYARKYAENDGCTFYQVGSDNVTCRNGEGDLVINEFKCDGTYTYYFQLNGTAMKDRLSYHPDGVHVIYFDQDGHEVFSDFANVRKTIAGESTDDYCFFDVYGYLYVDVVTYDKAGKKLYYANPYGVMERGKWFQFSETVMCADGTPWPGAAGGYGCANADGTLMTNMETYDWEGRPCYLQGNGVALYR